MKVVHEYDINMEDDRFREADGDKILELVTKNLFMGIIYVYDEETIESLNKGPIFRLVTTKVEIIP